MRNFNALDELSCDAILDNSCASYFIKTNYLNNISLAYDILFLFVKLK